MSIFGSILGKIFHHDSAAAAPSPSSAPVAASKASASAAQSAPEAAPAPATAPQSPKVDVGQVLEAMASMKDDHGGNYKSSIVDLLKLLDLESSISARKELGQELGVQVGEDGSAEQNIALHRAVMNKLAENGGVVPDSLRQ
jgi:3-oxoacyl-ACP reductase-like protein